MSISTLTHFTRTPRMSILAKFFNTKHMSLIMRQPSDKFKAPEDEPKENKGESNRKEIHFRQVSLLSTIVKATVFTIHLKGLQINKSNKL